MRQAVAPFVPTWNRNFATSLATAAVGLAMVVAGCSPVADDVNSQIAESLGEPTTIENLGDDSLEGHTPQGFAGSGIGLFAGDNLNPNFPDGEGIQIFLAFPLPEALEPPSAATLRSDHLTVRGDPFGALGVLRAEPVQFDQFGPPVFSSEPVGTSTSCEMDGQTSITCDVTDAATEAIAAGRGHLQLRLRFDTPGDGDGEQDLALFFLTDSNTNEPGIFTLQLAG